MVLSTCYLGAINLWSTFMNWTELAKVVPSFSWHLSPPPPSKNSASNHPATWTIHLNVPTSHTTDIQLDSLICVPTVSALDPDQGSITVVSPTLELYLCHTSSYSPGAVLSLSFFLVPSIPLLLVLLSTLTAPSIQAHLQSLLLYIFPCSTLTATNSTRPTHSFTPSLK